MTFRNLHGLAWGSLCISWSSPSPPGYGLSFCSRPTYRCWKSHEGLLDWLESHSYPVELASSCRCARGNGSAALPDESGDLLGKECAARECFRVPSQALRSPFYIKSCDVCGRSRVVRKASDTITKQIADLRALSEQQTSIRYKTFTLTSEASVRLGPASKRRSLTL